MNAQVKSEQQVKVEIKTKVKSETKPPGQRVAKRGGCHRAGCQAATGWRGRAVEWRLLPAQPTPGPTSPGFGYGM
jgi:hypothetical protein